MSSYAWLIGAVIFVIALTIRPFRIFVIYLLPIVGGWLTLNLGWIAGSATIGVVVAVIIVELAIWLIRRRNKPPGKQRFRLAVPRESGRP